MSLLQTRRKAAPVPSAPGKEALERTLRGQMARAAGTEEFQHRDPLYHITEDFHQTFDAMGRKHAAQLAGEREGGFGGERSERGTQPGAARRDAPLEQTLQKADLPDSTSTRSFYGDRQPGDRSMLSRFSETAFNRGTLSGAVLQGTGRMMLFSCLKKTVGQNITAREQQRRLFEFSSQLRNVPGGSPDKIMFNREFTGSAVGLVVDTLRDARRTVEDLQALATGKLGQAEAGAYGADTLRSMYPFLDDRREREMLTEYYSKLNGPEALDADQKALLQSAAARTRALIDKKTRMKDEFVNKLRFLSDRATEALAEFEDPDFVPSLHNALRDALVGTLLDAVGAALLEAEADGTPPDEGGADSGAASEPTGQDGADGAAEPAPEKSGQDA